MIHDLDKSIREMLVAEINEQTHHTISFSQENISFDPPVENANESAILPALNIFLYDIRENVELRSNEHHEVVTQNDEHIDEHLFLAGPTAVDCSYIITAKAGDIESEHLLLGSVMSCLLRYPKIPKKYLQGVIKYQKYELPMISLQAGRIQSMGEFWQAIGGTPKAALHVAVTLSVIPHEPVSLIYPMPPESMEIRVVDKENEESKKNEELK